jgi:Nickel responsive protein SCO4226-like
VFFIVERYLPGLAHAELLRALDRLRGATETAADGATIVRYLGSTIVPEDEACFCHFEAPSRESLADANRRAGLPVDRIVAAVRVPGSEQTARRKMR